MMGFRQRNSASLFLGLLGLGSILGVVNGSWLFGAMEEREQDYRRAMQPRQFVQCSTGSRACGGLGCIASRRCCNAGADWGCLVGNACYTVNGFIDCYSTTMVMPTSSRKCYDYGDSGCSAGQACFRCGSTSAFCATEVLSGGGTTWLLCSTKSMITTLSVGADTTTASDSTPTSDSQTGMTTTNSGPVRTGTMTTMGPNPTPITSPKKVGGGAIAGIAIGALAGIAILGALLFFCFKKKGAAANAQQPQGQYPQQQPQPQMQYQQQPMYNPALQPQQQQYMPQPPYSPLPGYQGQMAYNGYGPDGQPIVSPMSSPVYPEQPKQPKQPVPLPAELH
ncbi:hypothetical protein L873DRAFT_1347346 [Choiromyces venosus 120613-1]|uniref:Mid2 domain-containing protein n=1 Tax=Choiromyces venosus 120613-1 TaxID=1336337 RepID=A0A3N4K4B5_9PEZI|nr:hypothetical protein L873DRAFT_1347346 [Choiromyces venosus 120613-1]